MTLRKNSVLIGLAVLSMLFFSCGDDRVFSTDPDATLELRSDTVFFDTVFTANSPRIPLSVNKQFVVVNNNKESVKTDFRLGGGTNSSFRINVDGEVGPQVDGIEILPNDSVFVFVEVSEDPNNDPQSLPLIVRDSVVMTTNGNQQNVQLMAWGQDAHYYLRDTLCDVVLDDKLKPYVVYGYLYVPENCTLTIKEGVRMHFAPRSWLYVEGTLIVEGSKDEPVSFQGDRLQPDYEEEAGQWGGIWLNYLSKNNRIDYADIKNGTVGVYCDSIPSVAGSPNVRVTNSIVRNMSFDGLSGKMSLIQAENSVFTNCGRYTFLGLWGGYYDLKHCTFATYNFDFGRKDPTFVLNNVEIDEFFRVVGIYPIGFNIQNCIIDGSLNDELTFSIVHPPGTTSFVVDSTLDHCLIRATEEIITDEIKVRGENNVISSFPTFENPALLADPRTQNYKLEAGSAAINIGNPNLGITTDIEGNSRDNLPDAGAYEFK